MPDFVTHHLFGQKVLQNHALPKPIADLCKRYPACFVWGLQGPDLLYFHSVFSGSEVNAAGRDMHHLYTGQLLSEFARTILAAPLACKDFLLAYYYGFLCHYACDCALHPYVYFWQNEFCAINADLNRSGAHAYVESCIDSALYEKCYHRPVTEFTFKKAYALPQAQKNAIAWCYTTVLHTLYQKDFTIASIEACFANGMRLQGLFYGDHRMIAKAVSRGERLVGLRGGGSGHFKLSDMAPEWDCLNSSHNSWKEPFTEDIRYDSVMQLLQNAENSALKLIPQYDDMVKSGNPYFVQQTRNFCGEIIV